MSGLTATGGKNESMCRENRVTCTKVVNEGLYLLFYLMKWGKSVELAIYLKLITGGA